ncbi:MAG TPA: Uma2 family endonuclease [Halomicronema sp.]
MISLTTQEITFDQFLEECPEDGIYELVNGEIVKLATTRNHEYVADFIADLFKEEIKRLNLNYVVKNKATIKTTTKKGKIQGRRPDVSVINREQWRLNREAYAALEEPIQLAVEVTSTNWEDDYIDKLDEYERLGIKEYWIIDYLAIGSREYLGNPKIPSIFIFNLDETGKYQLTQFKKTDQLNSPTFGELNLTAEQILNA